MTSIDNVLTLAQNLGLHLEPSSAKVNESGLDFLAVFANSLDHNPWVLRIPRRPDVVESAAYEKRVLDLIRRSLPVSVPDWKIHTPELIAYPRLAGTPAASIDPETKSYDWYLDPQSLPSIFHESLAVAMVALHGVDHGAAANAGVRVRPPTEVRQALAGKMSEVKRIFGVSSALWQRWQTWLADDTYWPNHSSMVHADLHPGHILVDPAGRVTGLLDWTEAEVADPAIDFTIHYAIFGETGLAEIVEHYERAGGRVWPRMREHIIEFTAAYPVLIATFALKSGLEEYMEMARHTLGVDEQGKDL